jgi:hypothetical protein
MAMLKVVRGLQDLLVGLLEMRLDTATRCCPSRSASTRVNPPVPG